MRYRTMGRTGVEVSALGYGCMRYPRKNGRIDEARTLRQLAVAIEGGVNYFDTAFAYLGGRSEAILGKALAAADRDRLFVADKIPPSLVYSRKDMDRLLATMLRRLGTDRIDFLLVHALNDYTAWRRLRSLGWMEFVEEAKRSGAVRFSGFSWHGDKEEFKKVIDDCPWDFCQIQYNYLDEFFQAGKEGLEYASERGLGVVVMEPLRGGSLAGRMPAAVASEFSRDSSGRTPAAWALDWVWDHPGVSTALSGLNDEAHIRENLALAARSAPGSLTGAERELVVGVRDLYRSLMRVGCTACAYCMPCPYGVDIPNAFALYNSLRLFDQSSARFQYSFFTAGTGGGRGSGASLCRNCGACEPKCPQRIPIPRMLVEADKALSIPALKPVVAFLKFAAKVRGKRAST